MLLETEKENVCINQLIGQKKDEIIVEGDIIVNDIKPDVLSIISTSGIPCIYKKEVMDGKIKLDGSINTYIIYLADSADGNVRSLNTVLDFTSIIDINNSKDKMHACEKLNIKRIETKVLNGRKINIKIILEIETKVYSNEEVSVISKINNLDDIQMLNKENTINSLLGEGETKVYAKDTIKINEEDDFAEIMKVGVKITNEDIKISYNKALTKADIEVKLMYLTEDNKIKNVSIKIPVMGFIDMENISDDNICDVDYTIQNLIIKPNNQDLHSIYVEAEILIECSAYIVKNINLIEDLYSISENLNFNKEEILAMSDKKMIKDICKINEAISIPEIENNTLYNVQIDPTIINSTIKNGKTIVEGELNLEFMYQTTNGLDAKNIEVPFNFEIATNNIGSNCHIFSSVVVKKDDFTVNNGNIDMNVELELKINSFKNNKLNIIKEIETQDIKDKNIYSMIIYFVKPKDTLWKIAKEFKSTVEDIARINGIEDVNKINVGQQLYIPKFVKNRIAV